ncbi:MAG TPA: hypothetical protein VGU71_08685 [Candidatus Dormibacteraeota bacterium]|nr:hypothetical protein [Candidatus Dormibacteraeota bacterium]
MATVLDNVAGRAGLGGVTMAAAYHHGRDIFPHNPARKVRFLEGDKVFFQPDPARYRGLTLQPQVSTLARESDVLANLCRHASARSLKARAWTVFLHNYTLGEAHPECACRNAFGDAHLTDLCPTNPEVRAYVKALTADIAAKGVTTVVAESLHFHGLEHGFHHERYFIELGVFGRFLLGLCFCEHCLDAARSRGIQAERLRVEVRRELAGRFAADPEPEAPELVRETVGAFAGGELAAYVDTRAATVVSLVAEATQAAASEGAGFAFIDLSGAVKGYATGRPRGHPVPATAWQFGIDVTGVAAACGQVEAIGYAADPERLRLDLAAYRSIIGPDRRLSVIMRPMAPDCDSPENMAAKLAVARELGVVETGFYHYGFMRLESLDLVRSALNPGRQRGAPGAGSARPDASRGESPL